MYQSFIYDFFRRMCTIVYLLLIPSFISANPNTPDTLATDTLHSIHQLDELVVNGKNGLGNKLGHISVSAAEINRTPTLLGERDLVKTLQSRAGVVSGAEGFAGLYVRGGENDQNLYLVDGLPLLNVYHFGGLFSTFSPHSIAAVDFYKGGFPSMFSERASSIVDIALKKPDFNKSSGIFSVGLISGQLYWSTPIRKGSSAFSVSLRRTWFDVLSLPALLIINSMNRSEGRKTIFNYNFTDLILKFRFSGGSRNELNVIAFYGQDRFKLGEDRFDPKEDHSLYERNRNRLSWGNVGISAVFQHSVDCGILKLQPYATRAFASDVQDDMIFEGASQSIAASTKTAPSLLQLGMKESFEFPVASPLKATVGMQQSWADYDIGVATSLHEESWPTSHYSNALLSVFGELDWNVVDIFEGSVGLRANRYISQDLKHWNLEPRVLLKLNLPREWSLSMSYSCMAQYAQQVSSSYIYLPSDAWLPTATRMKPLVSDIYSLGVFKSFRRGYSLKGEVWWKNMSNIAEFRPNMSTVTVSDSPWYDRLMFGRGWAYGLDIEANGQYKFVSWTVAYGLMWNWRKFSAINEGHRFPAKFDNRNKIDISVGWKINQRLELTGQWEYMTGNRATVALYNIAPPDVTFPDAPFVNPLDPYGKRLDGLDLLGNRNNIRLPAFHRLNLNLSVTGHLNGLLTYQWDFGLYNAYSRMNPFAVVKNYDNLDWVNDGSYRKFRTLSLLPVIPSVSYTLNF